MIKQGIKIVILFVLVITVLIGGWHMYKGLKYNKQSFAVDIYDYVSPQAVEVININREYNLNEIFTFAPELKSLTKVLGEDFSVPIMISTSKNNKNILVAKPKQEQESIIEEYIEKHIALPYTAKERFYKDTRVLFYSLSDGGFLVCAFHKGLFAASYSYNLIELFVDSDPENSFFSDDNKELLLKTLNNSPISLFLRQDGGILAFDYQSQNDSTILDGYIYNKKYDSIDYQRIPWNINIPDHLCIDSFHISAENKPVGIKIFFNKKF